MIVPRNLAQMTVLVGILSLIASSLASVPKQLAYFNELSGGSAGAHRHLLHSNIGWGQDVIALGDWLAQHPEVRPIALVPHVFFNPADIGLPLSARSDSAFKDAPVRWYAVDTTSSQRFGLLSPVTGTPQQQDTVADALRTADYVESVGASLHIFRSEKPANNSARHEPKPD